MLTLLSVLAAIVIIGGAITVAIRWSPPALGLYPQIILGTAVLHAILVVGFADAGDTQRLLNHFLTLHTCYAIAVLGWWLMTLRMCDAYGSRVAGGRLLQVGLPVANLACPVLFGWWGGAGQLATLSANGALALQPLWYVLVGSLLAVSTCTLWIALSRAATATRREDRFQFLCIGGAVVVPSLTGAAMTLWGLPADWMNIALALVTLILVGGVFRGLMYPGLGASLEGVLASDPLVTLVVDRYGRLFYANEAARDLFGDRCVYARDVSPWLSAFWLNRASEPLVNGAFSQLAQEAQLQQRWLRPREDAGRLFACDIRRMRLRGNDLGFVLAFREETVNEKYREAALAARRMESLTHMAGSVAHRFNNLLVSVVGNVDIAQYEVEAEHMNHQAVRDILRDIQSAGHQAAALAKQLVTFTGNRTAQAESFDLNATIQDALELCAKQLPGAVQCDVAATSQPVLVKGDRAQVIELVVALVTNAAESYDGRPGSVRLTTGVRQLHEGDLAALHTHEGMIPGEHVFVEITDYGPGLSPVVADRLFDPFVSTKPGSQGLGLATVLGIVSAHSGGISVRSDAQATSFTVYLPAGVQRDATATETVAVGPVARETCLLVDDHPDVLNVHRAMIESLGQPATATTSPVQALEWTRTYRYQWALIDVAMPGMRGDELVRKMRQNDPDLAVILVSGYAEEHIDLDLEDGKTAFLAKPFGLTELHETMLRVTRAGRRRTAEVVTLKPQSSD